MVHPDNGWYNTEKKWAVSREESQRSLSACHKAKTPAWEPAHYVIPSRHSGIRVCRFSDCLLWRPKICSLIWLQNCLLWRQWKDQWLPGIWGGGWTDRACGFGGQRKCSVQHYSGGYVSLHLCKPTECTTVRVSPNINDGPWVMVMCQYWLINCSKCTPLMLDVNNGGHWEEGAMQRYMGTLVLSSQFFCKPKIA